jgi:hypothetical protein
MKRRIGWPRTTNGSTSAIRALFPERYAGQANAAPSDAVPAATDADAAAKDPTLTAPATDPVPGAESEAKPEADKPPVP